MKFKLWLLKVVIGWFDFDNDGDFDSKDLSAAIRRVADWVEKSFPNLSVKKPK